MPLTKLELLIYKVSKVRKTKRRLDDLKRNKAVELNFLDSLEKKIIKQAGKIDSLESLSIRTIYLKIAANHLNSLEVERDYYLSLSFEFKEAQGTLELIEKQIKALESELVSENNLHNLIKLEISQRESKILPLHLQEYKLITDKLIIKISLIKELEEALLAGKDLDGLFVEAFAFIKDYIDNISTYNDKDARKQEHKFSRMVGFQKIMIKIKHNLGKFEKEISDVYHLMVNDTRSNKLVDSFVTDYRNSLLREMKRTKNIETSQSFLSNFQDILKSYTESFETDLHNLNIELIDLKRREEVLFNNLIN